MKEEDKF